MFNIKVELDIDIQLYLNDNIEILQEVNNNSYDDYYVRKNDGKYQHVASLSKHIVDKNIELVEFPALGEGFTRYSYEDEGGYYYLQPSVAAALFGALNTIYESDNSITVQLGDMSTYSGGKPGIEHTGGTYSHINGRNVDVRYIRNDRKLLPVQVYDEVFDKSANQIMVNAFYKYGFRDQLSYPNKEGWILDNVRSVKKHHHHLHLQGFYPNIMIK